MKEKIVHLMKSEGLTSSRLAEILEIQPSGISHIVSGRNKPGFDLLQKILKRFPNINPDWLLLDSPEMYRPDTDTLSSMGGSSLSNVSLNPLDLFGVGDVLSTGFGSAESTASTPNSAMFSPQNQGGNPPQNQGGNPPQNQGGSPPQNQGGNPPQNNPYNHSKQLTNFGASTPSVQRIIVLYSDGTFGSYNPR